jgi:hypothetical protein
VSCPRLIAPVLAIVALPVLAGCATVVRGTRQPVSVTSDPPGADVIDQPSGTRFVTPATVRMSRREYHTLHVTKPGFEPQQLPLRREASVGFWIADAFTLGIGTFVDLMTGAMFHIKPKTVHVVLEPSLEKP